MQVCMLKNDLHKAKGGFNSTLNINEIRAQIKKLDKKNGKLEKENNNLRVNVSDLHNFIAVRLR